MARHNNTYSRVVAWLKVLLPVIALALLSTMFLISRSIDPTRAIPFAKVDVEGLANDQRISGPNYSGVTQDGAAITFSAKTARPTLGDPNRFTASELLARIETPDGASLDIQAASAIFDGTANQITLSGGVLLETSTNYTIKGEGLVAALNTTMVETDGKVVAQGPLGSIEAGQAALSRGPEEAAPYLLVFKSGVKLIYVPNEQGSQ